MGWVAGGDGIGGDVFGDDGVGGDDAVVADCHTGEDCGLVANPDIVANDNGTLAIEFPFGWGNPPPPGFPVICRDCCR